MAAFAFMLLDAELQLEAGGHKQLSIAPELKPLSDALRDGCLL